MNFHLSIPDERRWLLALLQPERMSTTALKAASMGNAAHIGLSGFDIALVTGAGTSEQVPGRPNIIADSAS